MLRLQAMATIALGHAGDDLIFLLSPLLLGSGGSRFLSRCIDQEEEE